MDNTIDPRLRDFAREILSQADIPQESKAGLWDHFHDAHSALELAHRIDKFGAPDGLKRALVAAKSISDPESAPLPEYLAPTVNALNRLAQLPPQLLELVEHHPQLMHALISAALKG